MAMNESELAAASAAEMADLVGMPLDDGASMIAAALRRAGYEVQDLQPGPDDESVTMQALLHDGPGEVTISISLG
jgi:hypothetical protein